MIKNRLKIASNNNNSNSLGDSANINNSSCNNN